MFNSGDRVLTQENNGIWELICLDHFWTDAHWRCFLVEKTHDGNKYNNAQDVCEAGNSECWVCFDERYMTLLEREPIGAINYITLEE